MPTKTKYQRGLCVFHGCKNIGTITPNATQRFCQSHWDMLKRDADEHEEEMAAYRAIYGRDWDDAVAMAEREEVRNG